MEDKKRLEIEIVPSDAENPIFEQRESGMSHSAHLSEVEFYSTIKNGNTGALDNALKKYFTEGINVGRMSDDPLRQAQYFAVCCVTLSSRYAMDGGLEESVAYNLSDEIIRRVDKMTDIEEIMNYITKKAYELTERVAAAKEKAYFPAAIKACLRYIDKNLHSKITVKDLAENCNLSKDYLSVLFKKYLNTTAAKYIMRKKLEASKELLNGKYKYSEVGYYFSFCSETHYISCFKREFGMTPREYMNKKYYTF